MLACWQSGWREPCTGGCHLAALNQKGQTPWPCSLQTTAWCEIRAQIQFNYAERDQGTWGVIQVKPCRILSSHAWGECNHIGHWQGEHREVPQKYTEAKGWADRPWDSSSYTETVQRALECGPGGAAMAIVSAFRSSKSSPSESSSVSPTSHHSLALDLEQTGPGEDWHRGSTDPGGGAQPHKLA